ncbi:hypothetical protein [Thermoactinomyces mirandus]|uniref:hypothetical protein n=1 Tax=Thermoactinomyces mirandus TaxID=2756294 RepID=UPI0015EEB51A|nr:hypothetical protein [Thermoactinomyces mirandus]
MSPHLVPSVLSDPKASKERVPPDLLRIIKSTFRYNEAESAYIRWDAITIQSCLAENMGSKAKSDPI